MRITISLFALVLLLASCTSTRQGGVRTEPTTLVSVENRNFLDMKIYLLYGAERIRIGTVTGNSTQVFTVPEGLIRGVSTLRFLADPIGGSQTPISQEISVQAGQEIELIIN